MNFSADAFDDVFMSSGGKPQCRALADAALLAVINLWPRNVDTKNRWRRSFHCALHDTRRRGTRRKKVRAKISVAAFDRASRVRRTVPARGSNASAVEDGINEQIRLSAEVRHLNRLDDFVHRG